VALVALPTSPADTVRSTILLRDGVPRIEERAAALKADLDDLARLRAQIATERAALGDSLAHLGVEKGHLERLAREKSEIERTAHATSMSARSRSAELGAKARDLRDLIERIEAERRRAVVRPPPPKPEVPPLVSRSAPTEDAGPAPSPSLPGSAGRGGAAATRCYPPGDASWPGSANGPTPASFAASRSRRDRPPRSSRRAPDRSSSPVPSKVTANS
jgi:hypothetical protein